LFQEVGEEVDTSHHQKQCRASMLFSPRKNMNFEIVFQLLALFLFWLLAHL
jgi:hypothetical protein